MYLESNPTVLTIPLKQTLRAKHWDCKDGYTEVREALLQRDKVIEWIKAITEIVDLKDYPLTRGRTPSPRSWQRRPKRAFRFQ